MKKVHLSVAISLIVLLSVAGQIVAAGETLHLAVLPDPFAEPVQRLLPKFEEETGIHVVMDILPYGGLRERLLADFVGRQASYDVFSMDICWVAEFATSGWAHSLDSYIKRDAQSVEMEDFLPGALQGLAYYNDEVYGLPIGAYYYFMHYRKDIFEAQGLQPPVTIADMRALAKKLTDPSKDMYGFSAGYKRGAPVVHDSFAYYTGMGGRLFRDFPTDLTPQLSGEIGMTTYQFYKDMLDYSPPGAVSFDFYARREPFHQGKVAMIGNWSSVSAQFEDTRYTAEGVVGNVGYTYMPRLDKSQTPTVPFGGWALSINTYSKKKDAAWEFIKWVTSPRIQKLYVADGGTPIRFSTLKDPVIGKKYPFYSLILDAESKGYVLSEFRPRTPEWPAIEETAGLYLSQAMSGQMPVDKALKELDKEIKDLVQ